VDALARLADRGVGLHPTQRALHLTLAHPGVLGERADRREGVGAVGVRVVGEREQHEPASQGLLGVPKNPRHRFDGHSKTPNFVGF
jgi:hypothetical protein